MPPQAEARGRTTAVLTIRGAAGSWGIPSAAIAAVERVANDASDAPPPLLALLGVAGSRGESEDARVLVVEAQGQRQRVLVHGTLQVAEAASGDLLRLPAELQTLTPLISHLAVVDGKPSFFVVSPERLLEAARRASTPHDSPL